MSTVTTKQPPVYRNVITNLTARAVRAEAQRDDLLAALRELADHAERTGHKHWGELTAARAAIAKAEGK